VLGLESPEFLLVLLALLHQFLLSTLLGALVQDGVLLLLVESLEMVGLDSVGSEHGHFSLRVFSHEIVSRCELDFVHCIGHHHFIFVSLLVSLGLGHLTVLVSDGLDHSSASLVVLRLGLSEQVGQVALLLIVHFVIKSLLISIKLLLTFLLGNPISLL